MRLLFGNPLLRRQLYTNNRTSILLSILFFSCLLSQLLQVIRCKIVERSWTCFFFRYRYILSCCYCFCFVSDSFLVSLSTPSLYNLAVVFDYRCAFWREGRVCMGAGNTCWGGTEHVSFCLSLLISNELTLLILVLHWLAGTGHTCLALFSVKIISYVSLCVGMFKHS